MANMIEGGKTPFLSAGELQEPGYASVCTRHGRARPAAMGRLSQGPRHDRRLRHARNHDAFRCVFPLHRRRRDPRTGKTFHRRLKPPATPPAAKGAQPLWKPAYFSVMPWRVRRGRLSAGTAQKRMKFLGRQGPGGEPFVSKRFPSRFSLSLTCSSRRAAVCRAGRCRISGSCS